MSKPTAKSLTKAIGLAMLVALLALAALFSHWVRFSNAPVMDGHWPLTVEHPGPPYSPPIQRLPLPLSEAEIVAGREVRMLSKPIDGRWKVPKRLKNLWVATDPKQHRLEEFHLDKGLSVEELDKTIGPPARYEGSGVAWMVYELEGGDELALSVSSVVEWADLYQHVDGKEPQVKRLFTHTKN